MFFLPFILYSHYSNKEPCNEVVQETQARLIPLPKGGWMDLEICRVDYIINIISVNGVQEENKVSFTHAINRFAAEGEPL